MRYYLNNFILFSFLGFLLETFCFTILGIHNKSGFLYLPWTPFYGTGVIIIILLHDFISKLEIPKIKKHLILIISLFFILSFLEFTGGTILEYLHGYPLWTYNVVPLHIGKFISIPTSILWVIFSYIYLYFIKKLTDHIIKHIPKFVTIIFSLLFIIDFILTLIKLFSIKLS